MSDKGMEGMQLCTLCSKWSPKEEWIDSRCPACGQLLILADEAEKCPNCGRFSRRQDIKDGKCPNCR